ncbi:MAG: RidA family protein [Phycisphaerales bacterium]|nr:RidA family protein [Phycisphaerales bacterium]
MSIGSTPSQRLAELGFTLPAAPRPVASYVPAVLSGNLLFISGQIPIVEGKVTMTGPMPAAGSIEQAAAAARQCALNALAVAASELGTIDRIRRVVRVGCFVASEPHFGNQPKVANGASDLMLAVFGEAGKHARAAVGSSALPLNVTVEVEFLFEVE